MVLALACFVASCPLPVTLAQPTRANMQRLLELHFPASMLVRDTPGGIYLCPSVSSAACRRGQGFRRAAFAGSIPVGGWVKWHFRLV